MIAFAGRNIKLFFRDRAAVFFSLLSVLIAIGIYAMFLRNILAGTAPAGHETVIDLMMISGILSIMPITATMGAFAVVVEDRQTNRFKDFYTAPIKRSALTGGYILGAVGVGATVSMAGLAISLIIIAGLGEIPTLMTVFSAVLVLLLTSAVTASLMLLVTSFFSSEHAFSGVTAAFGAFLGFLTGVYMPVGQLPEGIRIVVAAFPFAHSSALMRNIFMQNAISEAFYGAPESVLDNFALQAGTVYEIGTVRTNGIISIGVLLATAAVFFMLSLIRVAKKA